MIGLPFVTVGANQCSVAWFFAGSAFTLVGVPGAPTLTRFDDTDCGPNPTELIAATLKKYDFPFVRPVMTCVVVDAPNVRVGCGTKPMYGVTTYAEIGPMPMLLGTCQCNVTFPLPGAAEAAVGAPGDPGA